MCEDSNRPLPDTPAIPVVSQGSPSPSLEGTPVETLWFDTLKNGFVPGYRTGKDPGVEPVNVTHVEPEHPPLDKNLHEKES